jgi:hypothetical protein
MLRHTQLVKKLALMFSKQAKLLMQPEPQSVRELPALCKRHGFGGIGAAHGVDKKHRMPGSIGACSTPGRVFKGLRMAGVMGSDRVTTQNLTVHAVDKERNLLLIKGAVPGPDGGLVFVRSAAKKAMVEVVEGVNA